MLSAQYLSGIPDDVVRLYAQLEIDILSDMARRMAKLKTITEASAWQARILSELGAVKISVKNIIKKYDAATQELLQELFDEALGKSIQADMSAMNENQKQLMKANVGKVTSAGIVTGSEKVMQDGIIKTFSGLQRMTMTIASTASKSFIREANSAYMQTVSGAFDYATAIKHAVKNLAKEGVTVVEYTDSGNLIRKSIESAVRSNVLTGINQTAAHQTLENCKTIGCDLVEVSAHAGARPSHAAWQGGVYSLTGKTEKYESFYDVCKPGTPDGICGVHCKHSYYPYTELSERSYTDKELQELNAKTIEYKGTKISQYEAEQKLRGMERKIRYYKRQASALEAYGEDATFEKSKLGQWQLRTREYCAETGIKRDYSREYTGTQSGKQPRGLKPQLEKNGQ